MGIQLPLGTLRHGSPTRNSLKMPRCAQAAAAVSATRSPGLSAAIPAPQEQPRPAGQAGDSWRKGPVGEGSQWGPETSLPAAARGAETRAAQRARQKCSCAQGWGKEHVSLQPSCCAVSSHPQCPGTGSAWPCLHAQPAHGSLCSLPVAGATASTHPWGTAEPVPALCPSSTSSEPSGRANPASSTGEGKLLTHSHPIHSF